jgi:hypothetical protein
VLIQRGSGELVNRFGNIVTGSLDGNVVVLLEVDTGVLLGRIVGCTEKFTLDTGVSRARNVLSLSPLSITRATGMATLVTTTAAARVSTSATTAPATAAVVLVRGGIAVAPVLATTVAALAARSRLSRLSRLSTLVLTLAKRRVS